MERHVQSTRKQREICFCKLHPDPDQTHTALLVLSELDELETARPLGRWCIEISYDLRRTRLQSIERLLVDMGFHLDNSLLARMKRALYHYTEGVEFENLQLRHPALLDTTEVFINRYRHLRHGCRDDRPEHWRKYL